MSIVEPPPGVPGDLLRAISECTGRVTFVLGAGCSLEPPTNLKLSSAYSQDIFEALVADGEIEPDECADPADLSRLATLVSDKFGDQRRVVERLPHNDLRYAKANEGYLIVAALLVEGAVSCVATLNYDLALTDAVRQLDGRGVNEIAGPTHLQDFGSSAIVYLHRNVNEQDPEKWILRKEALDTEWAGGWESVVAARLASSPVVVFAGLGSPAAVLTDAVARIRNLVPDALTAYLADPSETSEFATALQLPAENHIHAGWCDFMRMLAERMALRSRTEMRKACESLISGNGWADGASVVERMCDAYQLGGLLTLGRVRAAWLLSDRSYEPDHESQRDLIADLLLGVGLITRDTTSVSLQPDGIAVLTPDTGAPRRVMAVSGRGTRRWSQLDPVLGSLAANSSTAPELVITSGFQGPRLSEFAPPYDIVTEPQPDDIRAGVPFPRVLSVDDLRTDPELVLEVAC